MRRIYSASGDAIVSRHPLIVRRYRRIKRVNHWLTALFMMILILSGFAFFLPQLFFLTALFGGGQTARWLHPFAGLMMVASFALLFLQMVRLNLPRREDIGWLFKIGDLLEHDEQDMPLLGKYNAGQKLVFWGMSGLLAVMLATGVMIWQQYFPDLVTIPTRRIALLLHAGAAVLMVLLLIVHVFAALWTQGSLPAMIRGTVSGGWAYRHHRKWLQELAGLAAKRRSN